VENIMIHTFDKECHESGREGNDSAGHTFWAGVFLLVFLAAAIGLAVLIAWNVVTFLWSLITTIWCYIKAACFFLLGRGKDLWDRFLQWRKETEQKRQQREKVKAATMSRVEQEANRQMRAKGPNA